MELREYVDELGRSRYGRWFDSLDDQTAARVFQFLSRLREGNVSNVKSVGAGIFELRMDFGPGFRVYFARDGERLILLLTGGGKARQEQDILQAKASWQSYKRRKVTGDR
ncbi:MAG: type II toxin-antitoxin system RelE/ParE family toxin [Acidobacteriota bacterium]